MTHTTIQQVFESRDCCHGSCGHYHNLESIVVYWSKFNACPWSLKLYNWYQHNISKDTPQHKTASHRSLPLNPLFTPQRYSPHLRTLTLHLPSAFSLFSNWPPLRKCSITPPTSLHSAFPTPIPSPSHAVTSDHPACLTLPQAVSMSYLI